MHFLCPKPKYIQSYKGPCDRRWGRPAKWTFSRLLNSVLFAGLGLMRNLEDSDA